MSNTTKMTFKQKRDVFISTPSVFYILLLGILFQVSKTYELFNLGYTVRGLMILYTIKVLFEGSNGFKEKYAYPVYYFWLPLMIYGIIALVNWLIP